ncbi:uncharacterized protein EAF01_009714 [Botrytis porri]|uniref:Protein BIG1 n=1 Tax=Botrytis porri TaxID=87229 RepID=A0A4Z1KGA1_9HELO|nr:uncharacterized protein EAF01_009714 [Botrytis porri]KAF7895752.1 hypothetical protein EAF01_009714 [Botrytis porri]TGO85077.1 hypothetical protein BPOR_0434g00090 [Botrytis porri]
MRYSIAGSLLCCAAAVQAFKDTSPFLLFSSSELPASMQIESQELDTTSSVLQNAKSFLSTCPSDVYIIIQQDALAASDFSAPESVPHMKAAVADSRVRATYSVMDVIHEDGNLAAELAEYIEKTCGQKVERRGIVGSESTDATGNGVIVSHLEALSTEKVARAEEFNDQDYMLNNVYYQHLPSGPEYTVIFTTTPVGSVLEQHNSELPVYNAEFDSTSHIDLKRDFRIRADNSTTEPDRRPLFEKYQYFTPGIFMGLVVGILLLSILYVGLSAVSSLQVSYGAFDKEMGPSAQKKQQ